MAQAGKADKALMAAAIASFIGGTVSIILFTLFAPPLAAFALKFGPQEEFALMLLAFATFIGLGGDDIPKTIFSILLGLVMAAIGFDIISGQPRMIFFDMVEFQRGIGFLVLAIGIYGIGEMLWTLESTKGQVQMHSVNITWARFKENLGEIKAYINSTWVGSVLGFFVGTLPAAGATPASLMSYGLSKTFSKDPDSFGKGNVAGVAAPEAANNAASTGSMLPMITLGIPGSPTTAILLGGMIIWGLRPGPLLFTESPDFVWGLIGSMYVANVATVLLNLALIPVFIRVLAMPFTLLTPIIFMLCVLGVFATTDRMFDTWIMLILGLGGYLLRKLNYPVAPAVLAIVLGPLAERSLRQSLISSQGGRDNLHHTAHLAHLRDPCDPAGQLPADPTRRASPERGGGLTPQGRPRTRAHPEPPETIPSGWRRQSPRPQRGPAAPPKAANTRRRRPERSAWRANPTAPRSAPRRILPTSPRRPATPPRHRRS